MTWFAATPIAQQVWRRLGRPAGSPQAWGNRLIGELIASDAVVLRDAIVHNA